MNELSTAAENSDQQGSKASNPYHLYLLDQSYYSGKLHAYMRYKNVAHQVHEIDWFDWWASYRQTGLMKLPYAQAPDGTWLQDTTPIILWMEQQHSEHSILPEDPYLRFFCHLLEDYADEWHWRPAMHYRWSYDPDALVNSTRFRDTLLSRMPLRRFMAWRAKHRQRSEYVKKDGVAKHTWDHVESIYLNNLDWLEAILSKQPFLLGDKPCLVDYGFMGPMFRHYGIDPTPAKLMRDRAPHVYLWVARMWNVKGDECSDKAWHFQPGELPDLWKPLVKDACEAYLPYLLENARAWRDGSDSCTYTVQGVTYRDTRTYDYRVWCREQLHKYYDDLPADAAEKVKQTLMEYGGWGSFTTDRDIRSGLDPENLAPARQAVSPSKWQNAMKFLIGTPWNTSNNKF